ncbi:hypothetical protein KC19_10G039900 [Ceratodon purpureus]|uniref:PGG domain-containing protein n=1 Tax=Ceratodon purpureus TaxID=3225 RepID=A0A8T0GK75_CERPU|nr:hypothetical protein KC19_10G039900 [Ceratodon purpureus]
MDQFEKFLRPMGEAIGLNVEAIKSTLESIGSKLEAINSKLETVESKPDTASASKEENHMAGVVAPVVQPAAAVEAMSTEKRVANFKKNLFPRLKIHFGESEAELIEEIAEFLDKKVESLDDTEFLGLVTDFESKHRDLEPFIRVGGGTVLHWAVRMEDVAMVAGILKAGGVDVNAQDKWWNGEYEYWRGATALHWAVWIGNMDIVDKMVTVHLASGEFDLNRYDRYDYSALDWALLSGMSVNIPMLTELLKFRHPPGHVKEYSRYGDVWREVEEIIRNGDASTESVQSHLDRNRKGWYGELGIEGGTWLHWAVIVDDKALALHILADGQVDANAEDMHGKTALQWALWLENDDMAKAIGLFDVNNVDDRGFTFLHCVITCGMKERTDMVKELLDHPGIRVAEESKDGKTPLEFAHERDFKDIQKVLMEKDVVRRYVEDLYRDRQVYVDAANAILVGAALIASVTFASWLQPPLGYGSLGYADVQHNRALQAFWIFNCLSFYFAIATVVLGARTVLPKNSYFIKRSVEKLRVNLLVTSILLAFSVFFVIVAFGIAGCIVLNPVFTFRLYMIVPTIFGGLVCIVSIALLGKSIFDDSFGKKKKKLKISMLSFKTFISS